MTALLGCEVWSFERDKIPQALGEVVEVSGIENATQIGVGPGYSCARTSTGTSVRQIIFGSES